MHLKPLYRLPIAHRSQHPNGLDYAVHDPNIQLPALRGVWPNAQKSEHFINNEMRRAVGYYSDVLLFLQKAKEKMLIGG